MTVTKDDLLYGALTLRQPAEGPRVNVDTILLSAYVRDTFPRTGGRILELGCASGAVSLILALRFPDAALTGLEIQEDLAALAEENAALNGLSGRISVVRGISGIPGRSFPPVLRLRGHEPSLRGARPGKAQRVPGRPGGTAGNLVLPRRCGVGGPVPAEAPGKDVRGLPGGKDSGAPGVSFRSGTWSRRESALSTPLPGRKASVVLVEALRGGKPGMTVEPPLFIEDGSGNYTEELLSAYTKEGPLPCRSQ